MWAGSGKEARIVDDIIDTAGTLTEAASALLRNGATAVIACATHGILSGPAMDRIMNSELEEVIITDTIAVPKDRAVSEKLKQLSVTSLLATSIERIYKKESISSLFDA